MENKVEDSIRAKMESLRMVREKEIPFQLEKMESFADSFRKSLESISAKSQENALSQVKLGELKARLREAEDELVKALAVKTRKEAKRLAITDSLAASRSRIEKLRNTLQDCKAKRDKYSNIISQQSLALSSSEHKETQESDCRSDLQEAISWYNRVLGFHIEGGRGVTFSFKKIIKDNPDKEYSFTIRHANDTYTFLDCTPSLRDIKELIHELNKTNGLFKFVKVMRRRFQKAAAEGVGAEALYLHQDSTMISLSAPGLSSSTDGSESSTQEIDNHVQPEETNNRSKKFLPGKKPGEEIRLEATND
ncbi:probable kinetochore protein SPC25 isoform X2 [Cucurbita pepo subsp. pepo]|uniref:probable kinetochore protein SPC25 isoform X2 n=1 Tax=Cucurbita pepo subsp. pepo TaxID=3664 RepID=UPI000C9D35FE|nr:probable kinetochore protein SPC25 isoform X2 [Cucurbita pepo subsp. pepo]